MAIAMQFVGSILIMIFGCVALFYGVGGTLLAAGFSGRTSPVAILLALIGCGLIYLGFTGLPLNIQITN